MTPDTPEQPIDDREIRPIPRIKNTRDLFRFEDLIIPDDSDSATALAGLLRVNPRTQAFPTRQDAKEFVNRYRSIADTFLLRLNFFDRPEFEILQRRLGLRRGDLGKIVTANRAKNLAAFKDFFANEFAASEEGKALLSELENASARGVRPEDLVQTRRVPDRLFTDPTDRIPELVLKRILNSPDLRKKWLSEIDQRVRSVSDDNIGKIDLAETQKKQRVKKNIVVVGGGPLTSLIASILGPYYELTVITDQQGIGEPWRSNPFFINSSVEKNDPDAVPLPLLGGGTTPIVAQEQDNHIPLSSTLDDEALSVVCDEGTRRYVSGTRSVGPTIATNIVFDVDDFILDHKVDPKGTVVNPDGTKTITLVGADGTSRKIDADTVIFLTGPGSAATAIKDKETQALAEKSPKDLSTSISETRKKLQNLKTDLTLYEDIARMGRTNTFVESKIQELRKQLAEVNLEIPRVLNLTDIQTIYQFWLNDLAADPKRFPLTPLFKNSNRIGIVGAGDSGNVVAELLTLMGPKDAYPASLSDENIPQITLFNQKALTITDFKKVLRPRYLPVFVKHLGKRIFTNPFKTTSYRKAKTDRGQKIELAVGVAGQTEFYDYVFDTTGYAKGKISDQFPFPVEKIFDSLQQPVALGANGAYIAGTATGFELADFPEALQNIIKGLQIRENTKALWVFGILAERLTWSIANEQPLDTKRIENLFKKPNQTDYLQSLRNLFAQV